MLVLSNVTLILNQDTPTPPPASQTPPQLQQQQQQQQQVLQTRTSIKAKEATAGKEVPAVVATQARLSLRLILIQDAKKSREQHPSSSSACSSAEEGGKMAKQQQQQQQQQQQAATVAAAAAALQSSDYGYSSSQANMVRESTVRIANR